MQSRRLPPDLSSHLPQNTSHVRARHRHSQRSLLLCLIDASERWIWKSRALDTPERTGRDGGESSLKRSRSEGQC